jgi:hypothetical protein
VHSVYQLEVARQIADERAARAEQARATRRTRRPLARLWRPE